LGGGRGGGKLKGIETPSTDSKVRKVLSPEKRKSGTEKPKERMGRQTLEG